MLALLALGGHKASRSLYPPARIFKVYLEALTGFSHVCHPDGLEITTHCFLKTVSLKMAPTVEWVGQTYILGTEKGVRSLWFPELSLQVNQCALHSMTSSSMVRESRFYNNLSKKKKKKYFWLQALKLYLNLLSPILPTLCPSLLLFHEHTFS